MFLLKWIYISSLSCASVFSAGTVEQFYIKDNAPTLKGNSLQLVCEVSQFTGNVVLSFYETDNISLSLGNMSVLNRCIPSQCISNHLRYTFYPSSTSVKIAIYNLTRSEDEKWWICAFGNETKQLFLTVYTVPVTVILDGNTTGGDLQSEALGLTCSTSNCIYPEPQVFQWYYQDIKQTNVSWHVYQNATQVISTKSCSDSENVFSSKLSLPKYTTWTLEQPNTYKTVQFQCRMRFPTLQAPFLSSRSGNVSFAVEVTNVTLKDGHRILSRKTQINIFLGDIRSLTCTTDISRPVATIVWYIGSAVKQRSTSTTFIYTAAYEDNNSRIYCKAFNTQSESEAVASGDPMLYVKVKVTSVILFDGISSPGNSDEVVVTENQQKSLTCRTGDANPVSTIVWYIDDDVQQHETNGNFSFIPSNSDHGKRIYCKAYNIQPQEEAVVSSSPKFYVRVLAQQPTLTNWTLGNPEFFAGEEATLICRSSPTRPAVAVKWKKGTTALTDIRQSEIVNSDGLVTVLSKAVFHPQRSDNLVSVSCETSIIDQHPLKVQHAMTVWWSPSIPSIIPTSSFPWLEGQNGKQLNCSSGDYGNPTSESLWFPIVGTSTTMTLTFPTLTKDYHGLNMSCQLKNSYTERLNKEVKSQTIQINIQYRPDVSIFIDSVERYSVDTNEGQNLTAVCSAMGNPVPSVSWDGQAQSNAEFVFIDINRTDHGAYRCTAKAVSQNYPDYDFSNATTLHVNVNFLSVTSFFLEGHTGQESAIVNEHDASVNLTCLVESSRNSTIQIIHEGLVVKEKRDTMFLAFEQTNIDCFHAGIYTCKAINRGLHDNKTVTLFVRCSPRPFRLIRQNFTSKLNDSVTLSFTAIAYPEPGAKGFSWYKEDGVRWTPLLSNKDIYISSSGLQSNLTIRQVTQTVYGQYRLTVENDIGSYDQYLFLTRESDKTDDKEEESDNKALIIGLTLGLLCIAFAFYATFVTILYIRKECKRGMRPSSAQSGQRTYVNFAFKEKFEETEDDKTEADEPDRKSLPHQYTDLASITRDTATTYDIIQTK